MHLAPNPIIPGITTVQARAKRVLTETWKALRPEVRVGDQGYVSALEDNLLPGVTRDLFWEDLAAGAGDELAWKIRAVHSSAALVVNTFARWKASPDRLPLGGREGFDRISLEVKCPVVAGRRPAHLDGVAETDERVVAIESKLLEPLTPKRAEFASAYDALRPTLGDSPWYAWIERLRNAPRHFLHLDAAQLVKHSLGLRQR